VIADFLDEDYDFLGEDYEFCGIGFVPYYQEHKHYDSDSSWPDKVSVSVPHSLEKD